MKVNILALLVTVSSVFVAFLAAFSIALLGRIEALLPELTEGVLIAGRILAYVVLVIAGAAGAATLYRYAPSRRKAKWVWITPGSLLAAALWLCLTLGFGAYVSSFGNYEVTYGSLGAVVVLLTWLYLSSYVLIFGAELNSEFERETAQDTTEGVDRPIGSRGAAMADQVVAGIDGQDQNDRLPGPALHEPRPIGLVGGALIVVALVIVWISGDQDN